MIDPIGASRFDPDGIHASIYEALTADPQPAPPDKQRTLVSYSATDPIRAWFEFMATGDPFVPLPLFLTPTDYIPLPLSETYTTAFVGLPNRWQRELE